MDKNLPTDAGNFTDAAGLYAVLRQAFKQRVCIADEKCVMLFWQGRAAGFTKQMDLLLSRL
jgi:hypothetical protein